MKVRSGRRSRRGLALLLVLLTILAMSIIATPFVLSMVQAERSATQVRRTMNAAFTADGARNLAIIRLLRGLDASERDHDGSPYSDSLAEFQVDPRQPALDAAGMRNPRGAQWGVRIEDEQGKIHPDSAPHHVLSNLRRFADFRINDPKSFLTQWSSRDARWIHAKKIRRIGRFSTGGHWDMDRVEGILVDAHDAIPEHRIAAVRISKPGLPSLRTWVRNIHEIKKPSDVSIDVLCLELMQPPPEIYENGLVEIEAARPVNVNTARPETLAALFLGLTVYEDPDGGDPIVLFGKPEKPPKVPPIPHTITDGEAREASAAIAAARPFDRWCEFVDAVLAMNFLDDFKKGGVLFNALNVFGGGLTMLEGEPTGTLPFVLGSEDCVTIESLAQENLPSGVPAAKSGSWSIVDLGPPAPVERRFENQEDFERAMGRVRLKSSPTVRIPDVVAQVLDFNARLSSRHGTLLARQFQAHPYRPMEWERPDRTMKPQKLLNFAIQEPARDPRRGPGVQVEHFEGHPEGWPLGHGYRQPWDRLLAPEAGSEGDAPDPETTVTPGGVEFWMLLAAPLPPNGRLLDLREKESRNRLSVGIEEGDFVFRLSDTSDSGVRPAISKGHSEIRFPNSFLPDVWYHVAMYWAGTRYGQMLVMIDGHVPEDARWSQRIGDKIVSTELAVPLAGAPDGAPAPATGSFPFRRRIFERGEDWIPYLVGAEVIEIQPETGIVRRGARGTRVQAHPSGAKVSLFGYSSRLREMKVTVTYEDGEQTEVKLDRIVPTNARINRGFGKQTTGLLVLPPPESNEPPRLKAGDTKIRIAFGRDGRIEDWPMPGCLRLKDEAIHYTSIGLVEEGIAEFRGCRRGMFGTKAETYEEPEEIELWSISVDRPDLDVPTPAILRASTEWFGPAERRVVDSNHYWAGTVTGGKARRFRQSGRGPSFEPVKHESGESILHAFAIREREPEVRRSNAAAGDRVTLVDGQGKREQHAIHSLLVVPPGEEDAEPDGRDEWMFDLGEDEGEGQVATFDTTVRAEYLASDLRARLAAWPSGELLGLEWLKAAGPEAEFGPHPGLIDEVRNLRAPRAHVTLAEAVDPTAKVVKLLLPEEEEPVRDVPEAPEGPAERTTGMAVLGEEVIGHADRGEEELKSVHRGWRNSTPAVHDEGDYVFQMPFMPVSALRRGSPKEARHFYLKEALEVARLDTRIVFVQIDGEILGIASESGLAADSLARFDGHGLFRGRFGTIPEPHADDAMVFPIPFRFFDGYVEGEFDRRAPLFQLSFAARGATWDRFDFETHRQGRDAFLRPRMQVRADGRGDFWTAALDRTSAVWHVTEPANSLEEHRAIRGENGQMEARYHVEYLRQSYWPNHSWKRTAWLDQARFRYLRESRVLFNQER